MEKNYKQFVEKLNLYIRKFYFYQLIRGMILFALLILSYYTFISILEYFNYFDPHLKLVILSITLFFTVIVTIYFVVIPVIKLLGLGKTMTYRDASSRLSSSFPEIKDKLINVIELHNDESSVYSADLKEASIEQKISELRVYRFTDSIRFQDLKKIFFLLCLIVIGVVFMSVKFPQVYRDSSVRLIHFQQKYEKPAPFSFSLETKKLEIISGESLEIKLRCVGRELPETVYISYGGANFLMKKRDDYYLYTIENLNSSISFYFTDKRYLSEIYKIRVLSKPFVSSFEVEITPPSYTNLPVEKLQNIGDMKVVSGTVVKWNFKASETDSLFVNFNDSAKIIGSKTDNFFVCSKLILSDLEYNVVTQNSHIKNTNSLSYKIHVVKDLYPEIKVVQISDSSDYKVFHFKGNIIDDYGFHQVGLTISSEGRDTVFNVPFVPFLLNQDFYYSFDFESVRSLGKSFKYYFSVYDNDLVNHFKKSVSDTYTFSFPDYKEILAKENADDVAVNLLFNKSVKLTEEIQQEFKNFKLKQINSEVSDWEKFQSVKDIMNKKNELENVLDQIKQQNQDANNFLKSFSSEKSEIIKKQEQIEELLKDVFTDELKKLFDEFNELAKQFDAKKYEQLSREMDSRLDNLSDQLERNLQLLKKTKVEQKVQRVIDRLNQLSADETNNIDKVENRGEVERLRTVEKENELLIENLSEDYDGAKELNNELEKPIKLFNFDSEFLGIKQNFNKINESLEKNSRRKAGSDMKSNVKDIDQLTFAMQQMLNGMKMKQNAEDIENIKQILKNLIVVSFDQEKLLKNFGAVDVNNPLINELRIKQKSLQGQVVFVKDSLNSLAKRTPAVGSVVNKELLTLESSVNSAFENLESGNMGEARMYQMYGITAANNLSLFLSESLESLKELQKNSQPGDGESEKKGSKSKPSMKNLKDSQMSIKEQLQKMIDQMKNGENGKLSKSIGQTLAQQEIMQQLMREMINSGTLDSRASDQLKAVDQMLEGIKKDLINKNITSELVNRQNMILSKLLDAEKAEIEREYDDKRESKTAVDQKTSNPKGYFELLNSSSKESEIIRRENIKMKGFYDQKYNSFINRLKN